MYDMRVYQMSWSIFTYKDPLILNMWKKIFSKFTEFGKFADIGPTHIRLHNLMFLDEFESCFNGILEQNKNAKYLEK